MKSLTWSNISIIRLGQECLWRLCAILPVISRVWSAVFLTFLCSQEGKKMPKLSCIAPFPHPLNMANQSLKTVHVTVPKVTKINEKSLCTVQTMPINMPQPLKSDSALRSPSLFNSTSCNMSMDPCWSSEGGTLELGRGQVGGGMGGVWGNPEFCRWDEWSALLVVW